MSDATPNFCPECPDVPDDAQWNDMYQKELLCGRTAKDVPDKLGQEVLRGIAVDMDRADIPQLVQSMHQKCIITDHEHELLTNSQTTHLERKNHLTQILMRRDIGWLLIFCQCLLETYASERGLDGHYVLLQQIKGQVHYCLKEDLLQEDKAILEAEDIANRIKSVPVLPEAKERLINKLKLEHLLDNLNKVNTSDIANAWLSANNTREWTILVEALLTEPGLGCAVSGILPLSFSNPPAVWNYVRDIGKKWEHLAKFLGYSDSLISHIRNKWNWDEKNKIRDFMRVCLIPDCGEQRTREIMDKIKLLVETSQNDGTYLNPSEPKGPKCVVSDENTSLYKDQHPVRWTNTWKYDEHHLTGKETDEVHCLGKLSNGRAYKQVLDLGSDKPAVRDEDASPKISKTSDNSSKLEQEQPLELASYRPTTTAEDPRQKDDGQELLQACISEQWDMAKVLIMTGSTLEAQDEDGKTPLHICCIKGKVEMVKLLVEYDCNIAAKDKLDNCCLHYKETLKNVEVASEVIPAVVRKDISVDQANKNGVTPLMVACQSGDICSEAAMILMAHGARVDGLSDVSHKPLICASARGNTKLVKHLLTYGADINQKDGSDGSTALIQACLCNHPEIVKILLESSPNVNLADKDGTTALAAAVSKNAYEMVQLLVENGGAKVNCTQQRDGILGSHEQTPLATACAHGYRDVAEVLIRNGANVNFLCSLRRVVAIAVGAGNYAAAKSLVDARGGPELALQEAQQNHLLQLIDHIQLIQNLPEEELMLSGVQGPNIRRGASSQLRDQAVKVEEVLQMFSQMCMSAITSNKDCKQLLDICKALGAPSHILSFIQEYYRGIQRQDILKTKFLNSDTGMSPANFFITHQFMDTVQFHVHALELFPDGPDKFYEELVWTFHQVNKMSNTPIPECNALKSLCQQGQGDISGGEDLPYDVDSVLHRLFSGHFSLNVRTATIGQLQGNIPFQHQTWPQPQPHHNIPSLEGQCISTAQNRPTHSDTGMEQRPSNPTASQLAGAIPLPEVKQAKSEIPNGGQYVSTAQNRPTHSDIRMEQRPSNPTASQLAGAIPLPEVKQAKSGIPNGGDYEEQPPPANVVPQRPEILQLPETSQTTSARKLATNQCGTTEVLSDAETPENERKDVFGDVEVKRKPSAEGESFSLEVHKFATKQPTIDKKTDSSRAKKPADRVMKSVSTPPVKGNPKRTPVAERKPFEGRPGRHLKSEIKDVKFLGKRIGVGAFGYVEVVEVRGKKYAGKRFRDDCNFNEKMFIREFQIMQGLKHDHIVDYYGYHIPKHSASPTKSPVLIMECLETNLHEFLLSDFYQDLSLARKVYLLYGIAQGLNYLHSECVIHRDLTATNVLLDSRATPKISDFGNSCVTGIDLGSELHSQSLTQCPGTLNYMAPEAQSSTKYGTEIDIFSFGHLALFVIIQISPTPLLPPTIDDLEKDVLRALNEVERREKYFTLLCEKIGFTHPLVKLIEDCLSNRKTLRPKADKLVSQLQAMHTDLPLPQVPLVVMKKHVSVSSTPDRMRKRRK